MSHQITETPIYQIYGLYDPRDQQCWYVGRTCLKLEDRLTYHWGSRKAHHCLAQWLAGLESAVLYPEVKLIDVGQDPELEYFWISRMINLFHPIQNKITAGRYRHCSIDSCGRRVEAKGLCHGHYLRLRAGATPVEMAAPIIVRDRKLKTPKEVKPVVVKPVLTPEERRNRKNALARKWKAANKDKVRKWYTDNREHYLEYAKRRHEERKALKENAVPSPLSPSP